MAKMQRYFKQNTTEDESERQKFSTKVKKQPKPEAVVYNVNIKSKKSDRYVTNRISEVKKLPNPNPKFWGRAPIPKEALERHSRGEGLNKQGIRTGVHKSRLEKRERDIKFAHKQAARAEILLTEESGFLEADPGETTTQFTQQQIVNSVDITAATKHFGLHLNHFGPYRMKYTRNGRHLLLGGKLGHVAAFDWVTKKLHFEINVSESVHDVSWLHLETMLAVAQKNWVYIYDHQGIELHCLKNLYKVNRTEFLPYHFLLTTASDEGYLSWLDVSIGKMVTQLNTKMGRLNMLSQNPYNALLYLGGAKGVVSMWTPNSREPVAKMLCHKTAMSALCVDPKGTYMATAACDRTLKVWDVRKLHGPVQIYKLKSIAHNLSFSQKNYLAVGTGNVIEVYRDCCATTAEKPYVRHRLDGTTGNFNFCPFEDVLGVASSRGFVSLLVPGSGEPNFDAFEANPFQTKTQRREAEVKALLEKIPAELITLGPDKIAEVDVPTMQDKIKAKKELVFLKQPKIKYEPHKKAKGRGGSVKIARNKKIVQAESKKEHIKNVKNLKTSLKLQEKKIKKKNENKGKKKPQNVLDRFLTKQKCR